MNLSGFVQAHLEIEPPYFDFGDDLEKDRPVDRKVQVWRRDGKEFRIMEVFRRDDALRVSTKRFDEGGRRGYEVHATLLPQDPPGQYEGSIFATTDLEEFPQVNLPYFGRVRNEGPDFKPSDGEPGLRDEQMCTQPALPIAPH